MRCALEVRRTVAAEVLVAAYVKNLATRMGPLSTASSSRPPQCGGNGLTSRSWSSMHGQRCPSSQIQYLKEFGLSTEELGRLLAFKPQLIACSIEEWWKPLVNYLYHLNISRAGMKRMLLFQPTIFCLDLETEIAPKVMFLLMKGGVKQQDDSRKMVAEMQNPQHFLDTSGTSYDQNTST